MTKQKDKDFEEYISNHTCEDELFEEYEEDLCEDKECDCSHHNHNLWRQTSLHKLWRMWNVRFRPNKKMWQLWSMPRRI